MTNNTQSTGNSTALIIGSGGQDGSYLSELLESRGTRVLRIGRSFFPRPESAYDFRKIPLTRSELIRNVVTSPYFKDLSDLVTAEEPSEIYHLAAHHAPSGSPLLSELDFRTMWLTSIGMTATLLEVVFANTINARVVVAGTSQMYTAGDTDLFVNELTSMNPQNYYAQTKADSRKIIDLYRELKPDIGQMAILFNHESPRRTPGFISTDIVAQVVQVIKGQSRSVSLRNPYARIDISDARDVVKALASMPLANATDFVIGSSDAVSVYELVQKVLRT